MAAPGAPSWLFSNAVNATWPVGPIIAMAIDRATTPAPGTPDGRAAKGQAFYTKFSEHASVAIAGIPKLLVAIACYYSLAGWRDFARVLAAGWIVRIFARDLAITLFTGGLQDFLLYSAASPFFASMQRHKFNEERGAFKRTQRCTRLLHRNCDPKTLTCNPTRAHDPNQQQSFGRGTVRRRLCATSSGVRRTAPHIPPRPALQPPNNPKLEPYMRPTTLNQRHRVDGHHDRNRGRRAARVGDGPRAARARGAGWRRVVGAHADARVAARDALLSHLPFLLRARSSLRAAPVYRACRCKPSRPNTQPELDARPSILFLQRFMHTWWPGTKSSWDFGAFLYRHVHSLHHASKNPSAFAGVAMHPVECVATTLRPPRSATLTNPKTRAPHEQVVHLPLRGHHPRRARRAPRRVPVLQT